MSRRRPNPIQWIWYAFGGSLPPEFNDWVLHDTTCPTWVLRQFVRAVVQLAIPIAVVLFVVPGPLHIRLMTIGSAGLPAILFQMGYIVPALEGRLQKAGFPPGTGEKMRAERSLKAQNEAARRYRERVAARRAAHS